MRGHYRNRPLDELEIRIRNSQISREGNFLKYVRKESNRKIKKA